ncbi:MAG: branched-chain-amino-acid transaminase [Opitutae bacterium]|jgi:branched-chain amino acid aminotransferase|nr:branched-chain-amino-acid transaminase [Opitutae bacterium]|tara:strand:+ start:1134 stop:2000 length:867 start_codon:yes stop_codon:yes gene_type:complete
MKIYLNGKFVDKENAKVSVFDHGLLYGDGVFEGIRLYSGCVFKLDEHLERLEFSAKAILLDLPMSREELAEAVCECCRQNDLQDGYVRLVVTRGPGHLGLSPDGCGPAGVIIIADNIQLYPEVLYETGLKIITVPTRRINAAALPPAVKSLNYLNNILAKIEAKKVGFQEALMLNDKGEVAECTGDNVFVYSKGVLYTPPLDSGSLRGITRGTVMDIAEELNVELREQALTRYDLWTADECFLTGTAAEVIPCVEVDHRAVGSGQPGEISKRFISRFREKVTRVGRMI